MANTYTVGDIIPFSVTIRDSSGTLVNATAVTLTIIQPDGTLTSPVTVSPTSTGTYVYNFTSTQSGRHLGEWSATGSNAGGEPQAIQVLPVAPLVTLGEMKRHLSVTGAVADDDELTAFLAAAVPILEGLAGPIYPRVIVGEAHDAGVTSLWTDFTPIISVSSLTELVGYSQFTLSAQTIGTPGSNYGYTIDDAREGRITRRGTGNVTLPFGLVQSAGTITSTGTVIVSYTAGRANPSEPIRFACKELVKYLWRQVHGGPSSFQDGFVSAAATAGVSDAMMKRLTMILGPECVRPMGIY